MEWDSLSWVLVSPLLQRLWCVKHDVFSCFRTTPTVWFGGMWLDLGAPQHPHKQTILYKKVDITKLFLVQWHFDEKCPWVSRLNLQSIHSCDEKWKGPLWRNLLSEWSTVQPSRQLWYHTETRVVELLLKGHTTQHWTDSLWWSIGSDLVSSHLARTCNRLLPWTCWTSSRITSPATPAVRLRTLFTVQEILYRVSCPAILSPGKSDQISCETEIKCSGTLRWLPTLQVQDLDSCGRWSFYQTFLKFYT